MDFYRRIGLVSRHRRRDHTLIDCDTVPEEEGYTYVSQVFFGGDTKERLTFEKLECYCWNAHEVRL